jgi:sortase A
MIEYRARLRGRMRRQAFGLAGGLMMCLGVVLVTNAALTLAWQDPITAMFAQQRQKALANELAAAERAPIAASTLALVKNAQTKKQRLAVLAADLGGRAGPGDPLGRIEIPKIDKRFVFAAGTGGETLQKGPGHYAGTALPGQRGTVAVAGHRTTYLAPFRRLDRMRRGDRITLTMPYGRFSYSVEDSRVVSPTHTAVLQPPRGNRLVLTTCTPVFTAKRRLIVTARLERESLTGPTVRQIPLPPAPPLIGQPPTTR